MNTLDLIRNKIYGLYRTNPHVHVNVSLSRPKVSVSNYSAVIKAVYAHVFQLEAEVDGDKKRYMVPYADLYTKQIEIIELK